MRLDVDVPERERSDVGGVSGASIRLTAQLEDVGGDQRVEAPRSSRPLSDLTSQIGSLRALSGGLDGEDTPATPGAGTDGGAAGGDGDGGASLDAFERYANCLDAADADDAAAISRCRELLP
jgi:hypothetical protein